MACFVSIWCEILDHWHVVYDVCSDCVSIWAFDSLMLRFTTVGENWLMHQSNIKVMLMFWEKSVSPSKIKLESFRSVRIFWEEIYKYILFHKDALNWSKVTVKTCIMLQKISK